LLRKTGFHSTNPEPVVCNAGGRNKKLSLEKVMIEYEF
jgi:hypothetical protein